MHQLWWRTSPGPHTEPSVCRIVVEASQASLCRHSLDPTRRNYFSIFLPIKTHSITRSWWKATDTGYFAGLSYQELYDIKKKQPNIRRYMHLFSYLGGRVPQSGNITLRLCFSPQNTHLTMRNKHDIRP